MIAVLLAAALLALDAPPTAPPDVPPLARSPHAARVLERYAGALAAYTGPRVISFEYVVVQTGARDLLQAHRVFRSGNDQRDEILEVDGRRLEPPAVRIMRGRRDRYTVQSLAPKPGAYAFRLVGAVRSGRHEDYTFATTPHDPGAFRVTAVTIDGASYLPTSIAFATDSHGGSGTVTFVRAEKYWVPAVATARATYAKLAAREKISFFRYRFPASLPPETFARPHALGAKPEL